MPRHTRPRPRRKHDRAHLREQRDRYIAKRWRRAKLLYPDAAIVRAARQPGPLTDDIRDLEQTLAACGVGWFVHPELAHGVPRALTVWPFYLERGRFARSPFSEGSDDGKRLDPRRAREKREWRRDVG
jgi:hypothetical protein